MTPAHRSVLAGAEPLSPRRKWRALLLSTLLFIPAYWALLAGLVAIAAGDEPTAPNAGPYIAFGLCVIPFVFIALAFLSEHPRAPGAAVKAMVLALVVGIPVSALAADAVTGLVAGLGAGGVAALRADPEHGWKPRAIAVAIATVFIFLALRTIPGPALLLAPVLPFTSIGVADHLSERRGDTSRASAPSDGSKRSSTIRR